jgi:hypothetical protein
MTHRTTLTMRGPSSGVTECSSRRDQFVLRIIADSSTIRGMAKRADYEPMTLGNMRRFGMTRLSLACPWRGVLASSRLSTCPGMPTTSVTSAAGFIARGAGAATSTPDPTGSKIHRWAMRLIPARRRDRPRVNVQVTGVADGKLFACFLRKADGVAVGGVSR